MSSRCGPTVDTARRTSSCACTRRAPRRGRRGATAASYAQLASTPDAGELRVRLGDERREPLDEHGAGVPELLADVGESRVPHVERDRCICVESPAGLLQQGVALTDDAIELESHRVVLQRKCNKCVVDEAYVARPGRP